ncbi:MAG: hypothetical protein K9N05_00345 [Candidatus Marinimicrobia bacterium]|nr:hypothetical protein [Candidatus Neomarinimicrobiota bacterium]
MKFVKISSAIIGMLMILQWVFFIVTGNIPEFETAPVSIAFHISIEIITAVLLIFSSLICKKRVIRETLLLYGQGMLGYTVINSAGYFAQSGQWLFLAMFAVLLLISIYNAVILFRQREH